LINLHWVRALRLIDRPHNLVSAQENPVPLPKFQMAPKLNFNVLWVHERNPDILSLSLKMSRQANPSRFPDGAPMEKDAHLQSLFYLSSRVPSKGALPQVGNYVGYVRLLLAKPTQSSINNIGSYHVDIWRELVRRVLHTEF
jgi:hypothetical protein